MAAPIDGRKLYDACRAGGQAQVEAFQMLGRYLYQVAYNQVRDRAQLHDLAEDCSQEALITVWQSLDGVEDPDRFLSWAARVVINKVYDSCRRLGVGLGGEQAGADAAAQIARRRRVPLGRQNSLDEIRDSGGQLQDIVADIPEELPDARFSRRELIELLTDSVARHPALSEQSKIVLIRGFLNDWDDGMLAEALHTTRSNIHTIRSRDLDHLRGDATFLRLLDDYVKE
jgi:RNA polymerase sigma factor (sigma-70 family)